jgi:outer membrane biosynthesis protein TonB
LAGRKDTEGKLGDRNGDGIADAENNKEIAEKRKAIESNLSKGPARPAGEDGENKRHEGLRYLLRTANAEPPPADLPASQPVVVPQPRPAGRFAQLVPKTSAAKEPTEPEISNSEWLRDPQSRRHQIIRVIREPDKLALAKPATARDVEEGAVREEDEDDRQQKNEKPYGTLALVEKKIARTRLDDAKDNMQDPADSTTTQEATRVMGSLDRETIRRVIQQNQRSLQNCFERALQRNPAAGGKVTLSFSIQPDGNVSDVQGTYDDVELGDCVVRQAGRWSFPAPKGGGMVRVTYPFRFRGADSEDGGGEEMAEPPETPLSELSFIPARGYFENTYLPGDPEIEWLRERLAQLPGGAAFDWIDAIRPYRQPFDPPAFDGLAVYLAADRKGVEGPARLTLQVGIKGSLRHAQRRSAVTAALVVDLRQVPDEASRRSLWTLADAMAGELQAGDRFFLVAAGVERPLRLKSSEFTSLAVRRALADALEEREAKGVQGSLEGALQAAYDAVRGEGAVDSSLGANLVLLIGAGEIGENIDRLSVLAHTRAVDGIGLTALGVGGGVDAEGLRELALSGQGRFRMVEVGAERRTIESELAASGSVVARAVRLRIRLMPGVKLISVLGSRPLAAVEADRVRQAEQAIDQRVSRILGIEADRGEDEDGIQIVIPAFFAGDDHVILLDVVVPGPGLVADVRARYKDLVNLKNAVSQASLVLAAGERPLDPLSLNVRKNVLAFGLARDLRQAAERLDAGQVDGAVQSLRLAQARIGWLLRKAPELKGDPELNRDREALASMRAELEERIAAGSADLGELAIPLAYSGRAKLPPRRTLKDASQEGIR